MLTRDQFLSEIDRETSICKHLFTKMSADAQDQSLGEGIRTNIELLRYLASCSELPARAILEEAWDQVGGWMKERGSMDFAEFPAAMDRQAKSVRAMVSALSERDLAEREVALPWGTRAKLGHALMTTSLEFLTAYRMQLFLHLKANGQSELNTRDCWLGGGPAA